MANIRFFLFVIALVGIAICLSTQAASLVKEGAPCADTSEDRSPAPSRRVDAQGEPLPPDTIARLGTLHFRVPGPMWQFAASRNGRLLAIARHGLGVELIDAPTGRVLQRLRPPAGDPDNVRMACSADGTTVATVAAGGPICVWEVPTGRLRRRLAGEEKTDDQSRGWTLLALSGDGSILAACGTEDPRPRIRAWDLQTGRILVSSDYARQLELGIQLSDDGRTLAARRTQPRGFEPVSQDALHVWDLRSGKQILDVGLKAGAEQIAISPDGRLVAVWQSESEKKNRMSLIEVATGRKRWAAPSPDGDCIALAFSSDGNTVASAFRGELLPLDKPKRIVLWRAKDGTRIQIPDPPQFQLAEFVFPQGRVIACGLEHGTNDFRDWPPKSALRLWDVTSGKFCNEISGHDSTVSSLLFSADGRELLSSDVTRHTISWDVATHQSRLVFKDHSGQLVPGGRFLLEPTETDAIVREIPTGKALYRADWSGRFSANGHWILTDKANNGVTFISLATGRPSFDVAFDGTVQEASVSADGHVIAARLAHKPQNPLEVREAPSGKKRSEFSFEGHNVLAFLISPDGGLLAMGTDEEVLVWDTQTGKQRWRFPLGEGRNCSTLFFARDGRTLVTSTWVWSKGEDVRIWDMATGKLLAKLRGYQGSVDSLALSPDGTTLATGGGDSTILLWTLPQANVRP